MPELPERWKSILGYERNYKISTNGRVMNVKTGRVIVSQITGVSPNARIMVHLWKNNKRKAAALGRLVLQTFVGPCPEGMECCHSPDRDIWNCKLDNLRWDTRLSNAEDKRKHGTLPLGENHWKAVLDIPTVKLIRQLHVSGLSYVKIGKRLGRPSTTIRAVVKRWNWGHVE